MRYVLKLLAHRYWVFLSETHGVQGAGLMAHLPAGLQGYWSAGTARRAGVGIVIKQALLDRFDRRTWEEWKLGRCGALRLDGTEGSLDTGRPGEVHPPPEDEHHPAEPGGL